MKKKIIIKNLLILFTSIFLGLSALSCNSSGTGGGPSGGSTTTNCEGRKYFKVESWGQENQGNFGTVKFSFSFMGCFNSSNPLQVRLWVTGNYNGGCYAYENNSFVELSSGRVSNYQYFLAPDNFNFGCNSNYKFYTVYASVNDGDTIRAIEPVIINVGSASAYNPKAKIEYDYGSTYNFWNIDSTKKTFDDPNSNFALDIEMRPSPSIVPVQNYPTFQATDPNDLLNQLVQYMSTYRSNDTINFPIYLHISHNATIPFSNNFFGVSYTKLYDNSRRNFSFIFAKKHEDYYGTYYTQNPPYQRSTVSCNICHELLHQIGNAIYFGVHNDHDRDSCVLNLSYTFYSGASPEFINGRMSWIVCPKHFNWLKASPYITNQTNDHSSSGRTFIHNINEDENYILNAGSESTLKISLSKNSFKMYEPILALMEYVNKNPTNDTILEMFSEIDEALTFHIQPLDGQDYQRTRLGYSFNTYPNPFIIKPNDSLLISRTINNFGSNFKNKDNYFHMMGYFNPGKYKIYATGRNGKDYYTTNTLEFEVVDINEEDKIILDLLTQKRYIEIIDNYPDNSFIEAVYAFYVHRSYKPKFTKWYGSKNDILHLYRGFFDNYQNSYYSYNPMFVMYLFDKLSALTDNIDAEVQNLKLLYQESNLNKFLDQEQIMNRITESDKFRKKLIKENKKNPEKKGIDFEYDE